MTKQRFWQRWLKKETKESLIDWLESQGVFAAMGVDDEQISKYSLKELQYMTFEEDYAFFWATIDKKYTGLPVNLRIDEIGCERLSTLICFSEPLLTFQNNYDNRFWDILPMSISQNPKVLEDEKYIQIKPEDVEAVRDFIMKHYDLLTKHWNHEINTMELHEILMAEQNDDTK